MAQPVMPTVNSDRNEPTRISQSQGSALAPARVAGEPALAIASSDTTVTAASIRST